MTIAAGALAGLGITLAMCPLVLRIIRYRLLDHPNHRSSHKHAVPRGGGLAIVVGALAAISITPGLAMWRAPLILTATGFGLLGLVDDLRTISALTRLIGQLLIAAAALPLLLHDLTGPVPWRVAFGCGVLLWLVSYVNGFNFMDGINGIAVAQALVAGTAWWVIGQTEDVPAIAAGGLVIAACALAFAPFNYPRANMFLGDVGSYFLGGWLAVLVVVGLRSGLPAEAVIAPVAVALIDTFTAIVRRLSRGEAWYAAHREHVYQQLVDWGWSHSATTAFVAFTAIACSAAGGATIAFRNSPGRLVADAFLAAILAGYLWSPALVGGEPATHEAASG